MAYSDVNILVEKLHEIKITDYIFSGEDLSFEKRFLEAVTENLVKDLGYCEVSHYLSKKNMAICCDTCFNRRNWYNTIGCC